MQAQPSGSFRGEEEAINVQAQGTEWQITSAVVRDKSKVAGDSLRAYAKEIYEQDVKAHGDFPSALHKAELLRAIGAFHTLN